MKPPTQKKQQSVNLHNLWVLRKLVILCLPRCCFCACQAVPKNKQTVRELTNHIFHCHGLGDASGSFKLAFRVSQSTACTSRAASHV